MKKSGIWLIALFLITMAGCSTLEVSQDYDPDQDLSKLTTFAFQDRVQKRTGDIRVDSALIHERIRNAIKRELSLKGISNLETGDPDFYVAYTYTISPKIMSRPVNTGVGIGYGSYGGMGGIGISTGTDIREYDQGLLIIDFLDPEADSLLWRGTSTREVKIHATPEKIREDIDQTISALLAQFPPG